MKQNKLLKLLYLTLSAIVVLTSLAPLIWMLMTGFKEKTEVYRVPFSFFPDNFSNLANYSKVLTHKNFPNSMLTTLLGASISTTCCLIINAMAAYGFARIDFKGKKLLWAYCLLPMFIPSIAILIPSYVVVHKMGMLNTMAVLIIPGVAQTGHIFYLRQYFLGIPLSLEEAVQIDGGNRVQALIHVFIPMSAAPFVIVGFGAFVGYWNQYLWPLLTISKTKLYPIMQQLAFFRTERNIHYGVQMAGSFLAAVPPIMLFMFFQRFIVKGIKISGLKG